MAIGVELEEGAYCMQMEKVPMLYHGLDGCDEEAE